MSLRRTEVSQQTRYLTTTTNARNRQPTVSTQNMQSSMSPTRTYVESPGFYNTYFDPEQSVDKNDESRVGVISESRRPVEEGLDSLIGKYALQQITQAQSDQFQSDLQKQVRRFDQENINKRLEQNNFVTFNNNVTNARQFISQVNVKLNLQDQLYKVVGSLSYNSTNQWCPILLRVGQAVKDAIGRSSQRNRNYDHLLQVWSRDGKCIFERELTEGTRLINWFINKNIFVWEENSERLTRFYLLKLYPQQKPDLYEIDVEVGPENTGEDDVKDKSKWEKFDSYRFMRVCYIDQHIFFSRRNGIHFFHIEIEDKTKDDNQPISRPSINQQSKRLSDTRTIKIRAEDLFEFKVIEGSTMKCFLDIGSDQDKNQEQGQKIVMLLEREVSNNLQKSAAPIIQDPAEKPYDLLFIHLKVQKERTPSMPVTVQMETLGCSEQSQGKLEEIMLVVEKDSNGQEFNEAISLHKDETVQFYFNLQEVTRSRRANHGRVTNITVSEDGFYIKVFKKIEAKTQPVNEEPQSIGAFYATGGQTQRRNVNRINNQSATNQTKPNLSILGQDVFDPEQQPIDGCQKEPSMVHCLFSLKNKISMSSCQQTPQITPEESKERWQTFQHSRTQRYVKLFRDFMPLQHYLLIAHRHFVSTYNFARECWTQTFEFEDWVEDLCLGELPDKCAKKLWYLYSSNSQEECKLQVLRKLSSTPEPDLASSNSKLSKSFFFTKEDLMCVNVFVGNDLGKIKTLKYSKASEMIEELPEACSELIGENINLRSRVIQIANDEVHNKGSFLVVNQQSPFQIMEWNSNSRNSFFNFQDDQKEQPGATHLLCLFKGQLNKVACQQTINEKIYNGEQKQLKEFVFDSDSQICVYAGADAEKEEENLDRQIEKREEVTQVMISNRDRSIVISLSEKPKTDKETGITQLIRKFQVEEVVYEHPTFFNEEGEDITDEKEVLIGCAVAQEESYKDFRYSLVRVTTKSISIYDKDGTLKQCYLNFKILKMHQVDDRNLYCILEGMDEPIKKSTAKKIDQNNLVEVDNKTRLPGVWMFDLHQLICKQQFEGYRFSHSLVGIAANFIMGSSLSRICFQPNLTTISLMPFFHRNTYNFIGMGVRQDYLIWRETPTLFTALHRSGMLQTWSICSGKQLYYEYDPSYLEYKDYTLYQSEEKDNSYMLNFTQQNNRSISLLKKIYPQNKNVWFGQDKLENYLVEPAQPDDPQDENNCCSKIFCFCSKPPQNESRNSFAQTMERGSQRESVTINEDFSSLNNILQVNSGSISNAQLKDVQNRMHCCGLFKSENKEKLEIKEDHSNKSQEYYNFKVLQLISSYDDKSRQNKVTELFNFDFPLLTLQKQRLYLSDDCSKLLVIEKETTVTIYRFVEESKAQESKSAKMRPVALTHISQFPSILQGECSANFLFSKDFEYMLDIQYGEQQFVIKRLRKNVIGQKFDGQGKRFLEVNGAFYQNIWKIGKDHVKLDFSKSIKTEEVLQQVTKRMRWIGKHHIEFVNDYGVSCYIKFQDDIYTTEQKINEAINAKDLESTIQNYPECLNEAEIDVGICCKNLKNGDWAKIKANVIKFIENLYKKQENSDQPHNTFKVASYCKIDNFQMEAVQNYFHYILEQKPMQKKDVFQRLMRQMQQQKLHQQHMKNKAKWSEDPEQDKNQDKSLESGQGNWYDPIDSGIQAAAKAEKAKKQLEDRVAIVLSKLFIVEYNQEHAENKSAYFCSQISFTVVDWLILEQIMSDSSFDINSLDQMQKIQLCFNVFPRGLSILHKLAAKSGDTRGKLLLDTQQYQTRFNQIVNSLFQAASMGFESDMFEFSESEPLEIPIIENSFGNTVIDMALCVDEAKKGGNKEAGDLEMRENPDLQLAGIVFANIKNYSIFHDGPMLTQAVIKAIVDEVPGIANYINSRFLKGQNIIKPVHNKLISKQRQTDGFEYANCNYSLWMSEKMIGKQLFKPSSQTEQQPQVLYDHFILDIPGLDQSNKSGREFISALDGLPNDEQPNEIFGMKVVQILIERHWDNIQVYYWSFIVIPYLCYLGVFYYWSTVTLDQVADNDNKSTQNRVLTWITLLMSSYFLALEILQMIGNWRSYYKHVFDQALEVISPILIIVNCFRLIFSTIHKHSLDQTLTIATQTYTLEGNAILDDAFWVVQAIAELTIWFKVIKLLYMFESTAYLMQMVFAISRQIQPFLWFLFICTVAIASTFLMISKIYIGNTDILAIRELISSDQTIKDQTDFLQLSSPWQNKLTSKNHLGRFQLDNIGSALSYAFNVVIANFGDASEFDGFGYVVFVFACIFLPVILMNLLIAIISSVYEQKSAFKNSNYYLAKTNMVQEFYMMTAWYTENEPLEASFNEDNKFLFVVSPTLASSQINQEQDGMSQLTQQSSKILSMVDDLHYWTMQMRQEQDQRRNQEAQNQLRAQIGRKKGTVRTDQQNIMAKLDQILRALRGGIPHPAEEPYPRQKFWPTELERQANEIKLRNEKERNVSFVEADDSAVQPIVQQLQQSHILNRGTTVRFQLNQVDSNSSLIEPIANSPRNHASSLPPINQRQGINRGFWQSEITTQFQTQH